MLSFLTLTPELLLLLSVDPTAAAALIVTLEEKSSELPDSGIRLALTSPSAVLPARTMLPRGDFIVYYDIVSLCQLLFVVFFIVTTSNPRAYLVHRMKFFRS